MAGKSRPLQYNPQKLQKHNAIRVHEDELPEVHPIPFKLDEADEKPSNGNGKELKPKRDGMKLDLPHIHYASRAQYFNSCRKSDYNEKINREFNSVAMKIPTDASPGSQTVKLHLGKFDSLDNLQRNLKKKLGLYLINKNVSFTVTGVTFSLSRTISNTQNSKTRVQDGGYRETEDLKEESIPWREFVGPYNWICSAELSSDKTLTGIRRAWKKHGKPFPEVDFSKVAKHFEISSKQLSSLSLMPRLTDSTEFKSFGGFSGRAIVPDMLKMLALTSWQEGCPLKTFFYLSEAQNYFIRREVLEKHSTYFTYRRKSYERCRDKNYDNVTPLDVKKEELFRIQSKEIRCFGNTQSVFETNLKNLNPDWNIIQLTRIFNHKNRFGASQNGGSQAFAVFLSGLVSVNGCRCPFVAYQPPPIVQSGLSKQNVIENLKVLMAKNRKLNEQYKGCRQKYWQLRSQHNVELKSILENVEENWIHPWEFLLPGNILEKSTVAHIQKFLNKVESILMPKFSPETKGILYKLVENYNLLKPQLQNNLECLVRWITEASEQKAADITLLVIQYGSALNLQSYKRSPTILVLDQELDLIPWESLDCLKATPVTRVPSISTINSLMVLRTLKKQKYAETVDPRSCGYVLNPDGSLKGVEERLAGYLSGVGSWAGVTGRKPTQTDLETYFQTKDLYLYCGHGSGSAYFADHRIQRVTCRAVPLLMGCGSVRYKHHGPRSLSTSIVTSLFSATSVCSVGFLYEITDLECDRVTLELLEHWAPGAKARLPEILSFNPHTKRHRERCLATSVLLARGGATQFLTSAGLVCYGIPIFTCDR